MNDRLIDQCKTWIYPLLVMVSVISGLVWSWGTWPDAVVDFGRELYVPWRLSEGQTLYRDIVSFNGPLSHYALGMWFKCFGVSLRSIIFSNMIVVAFVLTLLYEIFFRIAGHGSALLACLTFIAIFAFSQLHGIGNFNWMCPYSHELTHGIALSLLSIYLLFRFTKDGRMIWIGASGFILGLVFLTKAEVFLAGAAAGVTGLAGILWVRRQNSKITVIMLIVWIGFLLLPVAGSYMLFSTAMPGHEARKAVMGTWPYVFHMEHRRLWFFKWIMGTLHPVDSVYRVFKWVGWYLIVFIPAGALAFACQQNEKNARRLSIIVFFLVMGLFSALWLKHGRMDWLSVPQPWQIFTFLMIIVFAIRIIMSPGNIKEFPPSILKLMMATLSFVLLGKIILNVRVWHYGFALAMPAALMIVSALWEWLPKLLAKYGGKRAVFRGVVLALWLVTMLAHLKFSEELFNHKKHMVGNGNDSFRSDERGYIFFEAVQFLKENMKHGETLVALPEGAMMNYLLRVHTPTPFIYHTPPVMMLFGEERMLSCLEKSPPDWIALVHRDDSGYGARFFGRDYGRSIWKWIAKHYVFETCMGALPFQNGNFGILIGQYRAKKSRLHQSKHSENTFYRKAPSIWFSKTI